MPMAGAAKELAAEFGFEFSNGFVFDTVSDGPAVFKLQEGTLIGSVITKGRDKSESVEQITSFTGQGFKFPDDAIPVLIFNENYVNLLPDTAWVFDEKTIKFRVKGWSQGAFKEYGKGKIVAFGEAAMFTAQVSGEQRRPMGMNMPTAAQNPQFLLNVMRWLSGLLPER